VFMLEQIMLNQVIYAKIRFEQVNCHIDEPCLFCTVAPDQVTEEQKQELASKYTNEAIQEVRDDPDFHDYEDATADEIVRKVLASVDRKMLKFKEDQMRDAGITSEDLEHLRRAIEEEYGLGDKDFE